MLTKIQRGAVVAATYDLDGLAERINGICRIATLDLALRVGELIINELYGGNIQDWQTDGAARPSYRALAAREDLVLSASALCRAVAVYVLTERLCARARWPRLTVSHYKEVLPLPLAEQELALQSAETEGWTVARLRAHVTRLRMRQNTGSRSSTVLRGMRRLRSQLSSQMELLQDENASSLKVDELEELKRVILLLRQDLGRLDELVEHQAGADRDAEQR